MIVISHFNRSKILIINNKNNKKFPEMQIYEQVFSEAARLYIAKIKLGYKKW